MVFIHGFFGGVPNFVHDQQRVGIARPAELGEVFIYF